MQNFLYASNYGRNKIELETKYIYFLIIYFYIFLYLIIYIIIYIFIIYFNFEAFYRKMRKMWTRITSKPFILDVVNIFTDSDNKRGFGW